MATKKMLIDTTHAEETRVVIVSGNRLEDFDVEVESKRQLKSNIYLAKVTRVEPSLQAAFVDFGGNRHGFLAFSEIHPDYYQIPVADKEALIAEQLEDQVEDDDGDNGDSDESDDNKVESIGGDDIDEAETRRPATPRRNYKIQEVIKRRQILLVQVVKEERGNKGAALTTYISLPGRYCVLMPNTARGGGISRKISNASDRRKLKSMLSDLDIPKGVAVIVRTAGSKRTKAEIKRDYDYLMRLWDQVRETTLESIAPCVVYEEGNLIKRAIRDLYTKEIDDVIVEGTDGYRTAKDFMKLLIPSHAKRVQPYKEDTPLFHKYQVEAQLDAMHEPVAKLRSGGYLVINQTEALVAIDVNSGKATKERNIEETALQTNLEAADEVARQLRLRDLAGLVVIDFIDMEVHRNQTKVERQLKDAMRIDRARIQMGRISPFGLMEMSRQRLRPSLMETSTEPCPHCAGTGALRSVDSGALSVLRVIEEEGMKGRSSTITVHVATPIALFILNQKRSTLTAIEERYGMEVMLASDDSLVAPDYRIDRVKDGVVQSSTSRAEAAQANAPQNTSPKAAQHRPSRDDDDEQGDEDQPRKKRRRRPRRRRRGGEDDSQAATSNDASNENSDGENNNQVAGDNDNNASDDSVPKKRRRGRRGGRNRSKNQNTEQSTGENNEVVAAAADTETTTDGVTNDVTNDVDAIIIDKPKRSRSRKAKPVSDEGETSSEPDAPAETASSEADTEQAEAAPAKKPTRARRSKKALPEEQADPVTAVPSEIEVTIAAPSTDEPADSGDQGGSSVEPEVEPAVASKTTTIVVGDEAEKSDESSKRGWWRR
jgi:ribonuclease E